MSRASKSGDAYKTEKKFEEVNTIAKSLVC